MAKDSTTEQHLKDTARRVFLKEGRMLATTQDIADAAGVNRTLLHYYFRSRDHLFDIVFQEALTQLRERIHEVIGSKLVFREKIERLIEVFYEELTALPYLETFLALQLNQDPDRYKEMFVHLPGGKERIKCFLKEIQQEMEEGRIPEMKPINYFINLFSLMAYPYVARPIYKNMFSLSDTAYDKLLPERKDIILSLLFK
jgi:AcrR family transcriptional regulator